jgi:multiple antibiotic resistance protein
MLFEFIKSFIALFIIIDPFVSMPVFISLTKWQKDKQKNKEAFIAVGVAFVLIIIFLFVGMLLLDIIKISLNSFKIAGGIILLIMGIQSVLGIGESNSHRNKSHKKMVGVVIGTPLLTGPGALTTVVILSQNYGYLIPLIASALVLSITWLMLRFSSTIVKLVGDQILEIMSRVMGLLLASIAVQFIIDGILGIKIMGIL